MLYFSHSFTFRKPFFDVCILSASSSSVSSCESEEHYKEKDIIDFYRVFRIKQLYVSSFAQ